MVTVCSMTGRLLFEVLWSETASSRRGSVSDRFLRYACCTTAACMLESTTGPSVFRVLMIEPSGCRDHDHMIIVTHRPCTAPGI